MIRIPSSASCFTTIKNSSLSIDCMVPYLSPLFECTTAHFVKSIEIILLQNVQSVGYMTAGLMNTLGRVFVFVPGNLFTDANTSH